MKERAMKGQAFCRETSIGRNGEEGTGPLSEGAAERARIFYPGSPRSRTVAADEQGRRGLLGDEAAGAGWDSGHARPRSQRSIRVHPKRADGSIAIAAVEEPAVA